MTVWYAQQSNVNIDAPLVWNDAPDGSGNWLLWQNLATTDILRANGKTGLQINVNFTCAQVDTLLNGGGFILQAGRVIVCDIKAGTTTCINYSASGEAYITGNPAGGSASYAYGVWNNSSGTINITGNPAGGSASYAYGVYNTSSGTINITGNPAGGSASSAHGVWNNSSGTINITGDALPGSVQGAVGVYNNGTGYCKLTGKPKASASGASTGTLGLCARVACIADGASQYTQWPEAGILPGTYSGNLITHFGENLFTSGQPQPADVRQGVVYGSIGQYIGTCAVPGPASVLYGVPIDDTTGTAVVTAESIAAAVWDAQRANHNAPGTFGATGEWAGGSPNIIAAAVWDTMRANHTTPGTYGRTEEWARETPTALAAAIWDADRAGHNTSGTFGATAEWAREPADTIAAAVWDAPRAGHAAPGTFGATAEWARENPNDIASAVWDAERAIHTIPGTFGATQEWVNISSSAIAAAVWDALRSEHTTPLTFGAVGEWAGGGPDVIASAVWDAQRASHTVPGTFGAVHEWGATGNGARTVTITVTDGANPLENARVRVTQGAESYAALTDNVGKVTFHLDDATWKVAITKPLYTHPGATLVVTADTEQTYSMTPVFIPPSAPGQVTGILYMYDEYGQPEANAIVTMQQIAVAAATGAAYDAAERNAMSDSNGLVAFTGLFRGATYEYRRGKAAYWKRVVIPRDAPDIVELNSLIGID